MSCLDCYNRRLVYSRQVVKRPEKKKVTFNETVKVKYFKKVDIDCDVCWMEVARDRLRFKRRMLDVEQKIKWVFTSQHRNRVYNMLYL